ETVSATKLHQTRMQVCPRVVAATLRVAGSEDPAPRNSSVPPRQLVKMSRITLRGAVQVKRRLGGKATSCERSNNILNLLVPAPCWVQSRLKRSGAMAHGGITGSLSKTESFLHDHWYALVPVVPPLVKQFPRRPALSAMII